MSKEIIIIKSTTETNQIKLLQSQNLISEPRTFDQNKENERENYSYRTYNSETANVILACLLEIEKTTFRKSANWIRKSKLLEFYFVYWMMVLENGCHILTRMRMFLAKHNLIQINDYSFPLGKHGRKLIFPFL